MNKRTVYHRELVYVIFSISTIILINIGLIFIYSKSRQKKDEVKEFTADAYYEDSSVFQTPKDLKKLFEASSSSKIVPAARLKIPIILYHYVEYVKDSKDTIRQKLDINPALFEYQLKTLKAAGYVSYFVRDIPGMLDGSIMPAPRSIILTFDDGYEDFFTDALPILEKYRMKSTLYVVPHFLGKPNYLSFPQFEKIMKNTLVEIGSHTLDHTALKGVSETIARNQIVDSKKWFEEKYKLPIDTFAYPYGSFSARSVELVKEAGYKAAVSVIYGSIQSPDDLFYLTRIRPGFLTGSNMVEYLENLEK